MVETLANVEARTGHRWIVFGDSAFALSRHVQRMLKGLRRRTAAGRAFNTCMASARVTIENEFARLINTWRWVGNKRKLKLGAMPLAKHFAVAAFLQNCHVILYGSQTSTAFGGELRERLTLAGYIARRQ